MAALAGPSRAQRKALDRAAEACRAATAQLDAVVGTPAGAEQILRDFGLDQPPLKELSLAKDVLVDAFSNTVPSAWTRLLVESQLVQHVACFLAAVLRTAQAMGPRLGVVNAAEPWVVIAPYASCCATLLACCQLCPLQTKGQHAADPLAVQLSSPQVLGALASVARFTQDHVPGWTSAAAIADSDDVRVLAAQALGSCCTVAWRPLQVCIRRWTGAQASSMAALILSPEGAAAVADTERTLAGLRDSGVLSDLCAAVLAAPPYTPPARNSPTVGTYRPVLAHASYVLACSLQLVGSVCAAYCSPCAVDVLSAPPVLQFRMLGLMQLVASRQDSSSTASSGPVRIWPLLQRDVLRALNCGGLTAVYALLVDAAVGAFGGQPGSSPELQRSVGGTQVLTPAVAAKRMLPAPQRASALLSRTCVAVCSRLEYVADPRAAEPDREAELNNPLRLYTALEQLCASALAVLQCASPPEAAACTPDVLAAQAWGVRAAVSSVRLAAGTLQALTHAVLGLESACLGGASPNDLATDAAAEGWERLGADVQAACVRALLPTRLMGSLDAALRHLATSGGARASHCVNLLEAYGNIVTVLLPALLRAHLLPPGPAAQAQAQSTTRQDTAAAATAAVGAAPTGSASGEPAGRPASSSWRPQEELGVVVTAAKLARREAARLAAADAVQSSSTMASVILDVTPELTALLTRVSSCGLPPLLLQLDASRLDAAATAAAGDRGPAGAAGGSAARREAALSEACRAVAEVTTLCGRSLLELQEGIVQRTLMGCSSAQAPLDSSQQALVARAAAAAALEAAKTVPAALSPAAEPHRLLAGTASLLLRLREHELRGGCTAPDAATSHVKHAKESLVLTVLHLSADEGLLAACAPGWVWAEASPPGEATKLILLLENLAAQADAPDATPPGPVVVMQSAAAAVALGGRPWAEHAQCRSELAALARSRLHAEGVEKAARVRAAVIAALTSGGSLAAAPPEAVRQPELQ